MSELLQPGGSVLKVYSGAIWHCSIVTRNSANEKLFSKAKPKITPDQQPADTVPQLNRERNKQRRETRKPMGRISFLSKIPPPPILVAHTHHHRQYHYNASNASPFSFFLLIATVAAGEVLAIFVCKIIADYGE